jgi:hypothetical protein
MEHQCLGCLAQGERAFGAEILHVRKFAVVLGQEGGDDALAIKMIGDPSPNSTVTTAEIQFMRGELRVPAYSNAFIHLHMSVDRFSAVLALLQQNRIVHVQYRPSAGRPAWGDIHHDGRGVGPTGAGM